MRYNGYADLGMAERFQLAHLRGKLRAEMGGTSGVGQQNRFGLHRRARPIFLGHVIHPFHRRHSLMILRLRHYLMATRRYVAEIAPDLTYRGSRR